MSIPGAKSALNSPPTRAAADDPSSFEPPVDAESAFGPPVDEPSAFAAPSPLALEPPSPAARRRPRGSAATAVRAAHRRMESAQEAAKKRKDALLEAERTRIAEKVKALFAKQRAAPNYECPKRRPLWLSRGPPRETVIHS